MGMRLGAGTGMRDCIEVHNKLVLFQTGVAMVYTLTNTCRMTVSNYHCITNMQAVENTVPI